MEEEGRSKDRAGRRAKRFLTPLQKYEIYIQVLRGEVTMAEAAAAAGVDRTTVVRIRQVAKDGALAALAESRPGTRPAAGMSSWMRRKRKSPGYQKRSRKWP
jgi:transposase-like protein